jgi:hypothetical protein
MVPFLMPGVAFLDRVLYFQLIEMTCSSHAFSSRINELYQENLWWLERKTIKCTTTGGLPFYEQEGFPSTEYTLINKKVIVQTQKKEKKILPCSLGLSATSQQYFSLITNQQPANNTFLSEQISTSHQHQPALFFFARWVTYTYHTNLDHPYHTNLDHTQTSSFLKISLLLRTVGIWLSKMKLFLVVHILHAITQ